MNKRTVMKQIHFQISWQSNPSFNEAPLAFGLNEGMELGSCGHKKRRSQILEQAVRHNIKNTRRDAKRVWLEIFIYVYMFSKKQSNL